MPLVKTIPKGVSLYTSKAEDVWKALNSVFAVYKPAGNSTRQVRATLINHLCRDLNELDVRPPDPYVHIDGETNKEMTVRVEPSYADHELVVGPRYQPQDFKLHPAHFLSTDVSGIQLYGVNSASKMTSRLKENHPTRFFKLKGILGQATDNYFTTGKIIEKSTWKHVQRHHIDMICASIQSSHQRKMFELCGVDIQSQAAYELAVQGPIRPTENQIPVMYSMKCIDFQPPEFTLEVVCINENDMFLKSLVHGLGLQLRSTATCTMLQCYQYGIFNVEIALLKRDWDLQNIIDNMNVMRAFLGKNRYLFEQDDPILREYLGE